MTEITKAHAEWAVVDRLRIMLGETPHEKYNVTQSYGLCVAILAWVMQRIRTPKNQAQSPQAKAARALASELNSINFISSNFAVNSSSLEGFSESLTAFEFFVWLRDASCHGDARNIVAINDLDNLVGFQFNARCNGERCSAKLWEADLRKIGVELATWYCTALQNVNQNPTQFVIDAQTIPEGTAA